MDSGVRAMVDAVDEARRSDRRPVPLAGGTGRVGQRWLGNWTTCW